MSSEFWSDLFIVAAVFGAFYIGIIITTVLLTTQDTRQIPRDFFHGLFLDKFKGRPGTEKIKDIYDTADKNCPVCTNLDDALYCHTCGNWGTASIVGNRIIRVENE